MRIRWPNSRGCNRARMEAHYLGPCISTMTFERITWHFPRRYAERAQTANWGEAKLETCARALLVPLAGSPVC